MAVKDSLQFFGGSFCAHSLPEIPNKQNIKENDIKVNIWDPLYITKGEDLGGG